MFVTINYRTYSHVQRFHYAIKAGFHRVIGTLVWKQLVPYQTCDSMGLAWLFFIHKPSHKSGTNTFRLIPIIVYMNVSYFPWNSNYIHTVLIKC